MGNIMKVKEYSLDYLEGITLGKNHKYILILNNDNFSYIYMESI